MQNFFVEISKLVLAAAIVMILGVVLIVLFDDSSDMNTQLVDAQYVQSWLDKIENVEEKSFKSDSLGKICASENMSDEAWCTGYMLGFAEGHQVSNGQIFCLEGQFTSNQLAQSFKNFMEDNPQHWGKSRSAVLTGALLESFHCE